MTLSLPCSGSLSGRVALIAGGATGIGASIARTLGEKGAAIVIGDTRESEGGATVRALCRAGIDAQFVGLDVTDEQSWEAAIFETLAGCGGFDILVNHEGTEAASLIADADPAAFRRLCDVNLTGVLLGMKSAFNAMKPEGTAGNGGVVINVSSTAAQTAFPATGPYAATKAGVERLTRIGAVEARRLGYGVRVNCVYPGFVGTGPSDASAQKAVELGLFPSADALESFLQEQTPLGRLGTPDDVAETVAFLCTDAAFVTGVGVPVAGGIGVH
jgi:NAD(P)-dependent dehydrogenase (short-subunit alcohol dehydrogenase family)